MSYAQFDIVWVKYPFSDQREKAKNRPALIISNATSNAADHDYLICPITSTLRESPFSFRLSEECVEVPLPLVCEVRCNKIETVRDELILGKLSVLREECRGEVLKRVIAAFQVGS